MRSKTTVGILGLLGLGISGCDAGFSTRCLVVTDNDVCFDGRPSFEQDGSAGEDGGSDDATMEGGELDAAADAATSDAAAAVVSATRFCQLQFATALAFRERCSTCVVREEQQRVDELVRDVLVFTGMEACQRAFDGLLAVTRYEPSQAVACAQRFNGQFALPATFTHCGSSEGLEINRLAASVGKGAQFLAQLPECRATFVGSVPINGGCTASLQCTSGLRCLPTLGAPGSRTCQVARTTGEGCVNNNDCNDGLVCSGHDVPGRTCIAASLLRPPTSACQASYECASDTFCGNGACATPDAETVCRQ